MGRSGDGFEDHTTMSKVGSATTTAPANIMVIIFGGLCGSDLKMWWISGSFPYRRGLSTDEGGAEGSSSIFRSKAWLLYGFDEPKEAMTRDALKVCDLDANWTGKSLWLWKHSGQQCRAADPTGTTHQLQFAFAAILDTQWERGVEVGFGFPEEQEGLMRPAPCFVLGCCE